MKHYHHRHHHYPLLPLLPLLLIATAAQADELVSIENPATEDGREPTKGEFWIVGYTRDAIFPNAFDGAKGDSTVRRSSIVTIDGLAIWLIAGTKVTAKLAANRKKTVTLD